MTTFTQEANSDKSFTFIHKNLPFTSNLMPIGYTTINKAQKVKGSSDKQKPEKREK